MMFMAVSLGTIIGFVSILVGIGTYAKYIGLKDPKDMSSQGIAFVEVTLFASYVITSLISATLML